MINQCDIKFTELDEKKLLLTLSGNWELDNNIPDASAIEEKILSFPGIQYLEFITTDVAEWDSGILTFLIKINDFCSKNNIKMNTDGLPQGVQRLLALASAVAEREGARREFVREPVLVQIGSGTINFVKSAIDILNFFGEVSVAFIRLLRGKARFRRSDFLLILQECGINALPIVSLICLLVGLILAFIAAIQLMMFGAQIYIASLVGIGMVRVLGAVMAGIIMAGRTSAAFAAQIGTMEVNEEIDALKTTGISPIEFLVLPRILALVLMMPLLCIFADLMGVLGGFIVGVGMLDIGITEYYNMTIASVGINNFLIGIFQSCVFGVLVALAGCLRGMQCKRSASAVGDAATSAVVTGIISIVIATAIITVLCNILGI
jgi:phospholipid/cholesterol/gamma-HCH transport system permease protein